MNGVVRANTRALVRMVQGSHIVVPRIYDHERCYIFQNSDGRIVFAIPYERDFTLIGTTDRDYRGNPGETKASPEEIDYLCAAASEYFAKPVTPDQVVWTYSGVRPLYDDGASKAQEATRDYVLTLDEANGEAPLLSVFGGKITTYRRLAESALEKLEPHADWARRPRWTVTGTLPGGDFPVDGFQRLVEELAAPRPWLARQTVTRLVRAYGTLTREILAGVERVEDLGRLFGADLFEREVRYLVRAEYARCAADVVWRRSKLGLRLTPDEIAALDAFMETPAAD